MAVFNVRDFGAKGDGTNLDSSFVEKALKAIVLEHRGGVLFFPAGTYLLDKRLDVTNTWASIQGEGKAHSRLLWKGANDGGGIRLTGGGYSAEDSRSFMIKDVSLITMDAAAGTALDVRWDGAIVRSPIKKLVVRDVEITQFDYHGNNPKGSWAKGIRCFVPWEVDISHVSIHVAREDGILFAYPSCCGMYLSHIYVNLARTAIRLRHGPEGFFLSNFQLVNVQIGIDGRAHLDESEAATNFKGTVFAMTNGHIDTQLHAIVFENSENVQISNVSAWISNSTTPSNVTSFTKCSAVAISSSRINNNRGAVNTNGIRLDNCNGVFVYGNFVDMGGTGQSVLNNNSSSVHVWP